MTGWNSLTGVVWVLLRWMLENRGWRLFLEGILISVAVEHVVAWAVQEKS